MFLRLVSVDRDLPVNLVTVRGVAIRSHFGSSMGSSLTAMTSLAKLWHDCLDKQSLAYMTSPHGNLIVRRSGKLSMVDLRLNCKLLVLAFRCYPAWIPSKYVLASGVAELDKLLGGCT